MGQMPKYSFVAFFTSILLLQTVWNDCDAIATHVAAFRFDQSMQVSGDEHVCVIGLAVMCVVPVFLVYCGVGEVG